MPSHTKSLTQGKSHPTSLLQSQHNISNDITLLQHYLTPYKRAIIFTYYLPSKMLNQFCIGKEEHIIKGWKEGDSKIKS